MVVLCCIVVVTGFLPFLVSRSSLSSPPSQVCIYSSQSLSHQPTLRQSIMSPEFQQAKTKGRKGVSKVKVGWFEKGWLDWMVVLIGIRVYGLLL